MSVSTQLDVAALLPPGTKAQVHPRVTDAAPTAWGASVKNVTIPDDGTVKLTGLVEHGQYWLVGQVEGAQRAVAFNADGKLNASDPNSPEGLREELYARSEAAKEVRSQHKHLQPAGTPPPPEEDLRQGIPAHNFEKSDTGEKHPNPRMRMADAPKGTPLRSGGDLGTAYPVDPKEIQPQPGQDDMPKGAPQRSDTELGYAYPVDPAEVQPNMKHEDYDGPQLTGADIGQAEPAPEGSDVEYNRRMDDSVSKAKGTNVPKLEDHPVPTAKQTKDDEEGKRPPSKTPAEPTAAAKKDSLKAHETNEPAPTPADVQARKAK
jgi:hypothetical protein